MITDDQLIDAVLRRELPPGVTWDQSRALRKASDRGGWTRGGITATSWGRHKGFGRQATRAALDAITEAEARAFYQQLYLAPFAAYPDWLRHVLIDFGVTSSHRAVFRALVLIRLFQQATTGSVSAWRARRFRRISGSFSGNLRPPRPVRTTWRRAAGRTALCVPGAGTRAAIT